MFNNITYLIVRRAQSYKCISQVLSDCATAIEGKVKFFATRIGTHILHLLYCIGSGYFSPPGELFACLLFYNMFTLMKVRTYA